MGIGWLLIALTIGFIFVIIQNKRQLTWSFYKNLNLTQLENELFQLLVEILDPVDSNNELFKCRLSIILMLLIRKLPITKLL